MSDKARQCPEASDLLKHPVEPVKVDPEADLRQIILDMAKISFQGRMLGEALEIWEAMLDEGCYNYMGLAGAMAPAGMRDVVDWLIQTGKIHCLVSTGANLFHELHECLGRRHYRTHPHIDDVMLKKYDIDRMYDTLAPDEEFRETDAYVYEFAREIADESDRTSTRRFFDRLGKKLKSEGKQGFIVTAHEKQVPVFCPALGDSSYGIAMATFGDKLNLTFDMLADIVEVAIPISEQRKTGVIYVGGGTPKNFIQQAELIGQEKLRHEQGMSNVEAEALVPGHSYAVQISTDTPQWGGLSGCTLQEGQSWGKEAKDARMVNLHCDATIALPLLANALALKDSGGN